MMGTPPDKPTLQWLRHTPGTCPNSRCTVASALSLSSQQDPRPDSPRSRLFGSQPLLYLLHYPWTAAGGLLHNIYIYTYVHTQRYTTAHTCSTDSTNRAWQDSKNVAFANSIGGRFTAKVTKQAGQSWVAQAYS